MQRVKCFQYELGSGFRDYSVLLCGAGSGSDDNVFFNTKLVPGSGNVMFYNLRFGPGAEHIMA